MVLGRSVSKMPTITIRVEGGIVTDVEGLPPEWDVEINDLDAKRVGEG